MIRAHSLFFRHQGASADALCGLEFEIPRGAVCCVLGVNGSGKSTLLGLLAGVFRPTSGSLTLGEPAQVQPEPTGATAFVPQDPDAYILGSLVKEDLFLGIEPGDGERRKQALDIANRFGLGDQLEAPVQTLSFGQKRKLCLASALAGSPHVLLLDEPFAGLDHPGVLFVRETIIANRQQGISQIMTGHDLDIMADLGDVFLLLHNGNQLWFGDSGGLYPLLAKAGVRPPCWWFTGEQRPLWQAGR